MFHTIKQQIYYYDTDAEGVVYYGNYLKFLEVARTKFIEDLGFNLKKISDEGVQFAIRKQEIEYKMPIYYGEVIEIRTKIIELTAYRIVFYYEIYNEKNEKTSIAKTDMVSINKNFKLTEIPENLIKTIKNNNK